MKRTKADYAELALGVACTLLLASMAIVAQAWDIAITAAMAGGLTVAILLRQENEEE